MRHQFRGTLDNLAVNRVLDPALYQHSDSFVTFIRDDFAGSGPAHCIRLCHD
jgi:hypothetical protein